MSDFALCRGERRFANGVADLCPKRVYCRRYLTTPGDDQFQSWIFPPEEMASCTEFWPVQFIREERD